MYPPEPLSSLASMNCPHPSVPTLFSYFGFPSALMGSQVQVMPKQAMLVDSSLHCLCALPHQLQARHAARSWETSTHRCLTIAHQKLEEWGNGQGCED